MPSHPTAALHRERSGHPTQFGARARTLAALHREAQVDWGPVGLLGGSSQLLSG